MRTGKVVLSQEEMFNLDLRNQIIQQKQAELQMLMREKELYQRELLQRYGLDVNKNYSVDARGVVTEEENANNTRIENRSGEGNSASS